MRYSHRVMRGDAFDVLSDRELEVALLLVRGWRMREVAGELGISIKTVDTHRGHALAKLGLRNNVALVWAALACGYVNALDADVRTAP